jgi:hypothetical protein
MFLAESATPSSGVLWMFFYRPHGTMNVRPCMQQHRPSASDSAPLQPSAADLFFDGDSQSIQLSAINQHI